MRNNIKRVIFAGYRDWALRVIEEVTRRGDVQVLKCVQSNEEFESYMQTVSPEDVDVIIIIGWSWIIQDIITQRYLCLGIHPSDLPSYRGGSPIQHQIMDGLKKSKVSMMTIGQGKIDSGDIWGKEDVDLTGDSMEVVLDHIACSSIKLLDSFFDQYPFITPKQQNPETGTYFNRRTPDESRLTMQMMSEMSIENLYDFIRALTEPYPNAYLEDEQGNRLVFQKVTFIQNDNPNKKEIGK